jgi:ferredoxin
MESADKSIDVQQQPTAGVYSVTVVNEIGDDQTLVYSPSDKTLLNCLESSNVEVHYHCRDGYCGACRCKLIKGEVQYDVEPLAYVGDDEILTCCAQPLTDIELDLHG